MKKIYLLILLFFAGSGYLLAQNLEFYFGSGIANSNMVDLKSAQEISLSSIDVPAKLTEDFPARFYFMGEARYKVSNVYFGLQYSFASTGSRISYKDYSGTMNIDIISSSHKLAPLISFPVLSRKNLSLNLSLSTPFIFSKVTFADYLEVYGEVFKDSLLVYSTSIGFNPGAEINYKISFFSLGIRAGYLLDTKGFLHMLDNKDAYLEIKNNEKVYTNWSGYRFEFLIGMRILTKPLNQIHIPEWLRQGNNYHFQNKML